MKKTICGAGGTAVVTGAKCTCSMGSAPSNLTASPNSNISSKGKKVLTIKDNIIGVNITPFGQCNATQPPTPCAPSFPGPWVGEPNSFKMNSIDVLDVKCQLICARGGTVSITSSGQ